MVIQFDAKLSEGKEKLEVKYVFTNYFFHAIITLMKT